MNEIFFYCKFFVRQLLQVLSDMPIEAVLDLVSQVRDVVLMNVYSDQGDPGGRDFGMRGIWARGGKWEDQFTSNLGTRWKGSYHSKEGSK